MKKYFSFLLLLLSVSFLSAQEITITGTITDKEGNEMPGVNVVIIGSSFGVISDVNGDYSITTENKESLQLGFSFIGYEKKKILVAGRKKINVSLKEIAKELDQYVVVGYGKTTVKELTGATSKVKGENVEKLNIARMDQALQGQVSGVAINTNSGSPGGSSSIRIRGLSTFGDNDPLILVDGVVYDSEGLNALNPSDIESINVLKDATAGIYGVRAANGVIIVETKKGTRNSKPKFEASTFYGVQQTTKKLNLLSASQYAVIKNQMHLNGGDPRPFQNEALGIGTNWQDTIFQSAPMASYNLSINGGTENSSYSIGGSYYSQDGIIGGSKANFDRYNGRVNVSTDLSKKLKLSSVFLFTNESRSALPENGIGSVLYNTINAFPTDPVIENGHYSYLEEVSDIINPVAQIINTHNQALVKKLVGKQEFEYKFNKDFTFTNRFSYNYALVDNKSFSPLAWYGPGKYANNAANENLDPVLVEIADSVFIERGASVFEQRATYLDLNYEGFINYNHTFNENHNVRATLGTSIFKRRGEVLNGTAYNIPNNSIDFADISANLAPGGFLNNVGSYEFEERLLSTFLRAEYGFKYKYLISAILRRDGSTKFGANNRYGFFPTISGGWIISDEDFYNSKSISFLKLRTSYGISGNDQIDNFAYRALLNGEGVYVFNDIITSGVALGRAANPDLKWETTRQLNIGLDMEVFSSFDVTLNYFIKNTYNLLFQPDVSGVLGSYGPGGYPPIINAGDVSNKGLELEINYQSDQKREFKYNVSANLASIKNKVLKVPEGVDFIPGASFGVGGNVATRFEEGFAIGYFHGYETNGIFQNQEQIDNSPVYQEGAQPGDLIFVDQNQDGIISFNDNNDKTNIGSPIPKLNLGFALSLNYKGFDLSTNLYAATGQQIIRNFERQQPYANQLSYVWNRWTGENTSNEHPRVTTGSTRNTVFSDYYVEDGSFLRFRNIQLGYTLPKKLTQKFKTESVRFYVSANNLFTLTNYQGYDPDIGASAGTLSAGVDYGFYPQAKTIMGGLMIKF
ncbi:MAG: SusC/RagA family TonB-linked outer membrane protein [Crocinitomicaceae bacterium]|nr:SusC/RagA family TonB-linked outer membrane protein [Crocinitomicaceae bacterium]|tara:strand:- start:12505 stop:15597 length:3093 start_codon:yes stop_codon:yes gene_type:complete